MRRTRPQRPGRRERGTTLLGFVGGLLAGLALAVAVALYITNAPVPFVNKVQRPTDTIVPGALDPNKGLNPIVAPALPAPADVPGKAVAGAGAAAVPAPTPPTAVGALPQGGTLPPGGAAATAAGKDLPPDDAALYLLQAGAFKTPDDAEAMRARLGMLGMDAKVSERQQDGARLYRVRIGPYGQMTDLEKIRKMLAENGIDAQLVKLR
jgi:cell division protein FtsN